MEDEKKQGERIIRIRQIMAKSGDARSTIYYKMKEGTFPKQIKLGERGVGWIESEIDDLIQKRIQESRK